MNMKLLLKLLGAFVAAVIVHEIIGMRRAAKWEMERAIEIMEAREREWE